MKNPITIISEREFGETEFKAAFKQNKFLFAGRFKARDIHEHFERARKVFR